MKSFPDKMLPLDMHNSLLDRKNSTYERRFAQVDLKIIEKNMRLASAFERRRSVG
jgi:hypothetical protein